MPNNDTTVADQVNTSSSNNVTNINNCYTTPVVDAISAAHIYVDAAIWSKIIVHDSGKPHWPAIFMFSKILYWYQRTEVFHEETGAFIGYKKKFKADMLQRSYGQFAEEIGCSPSEAHSGLKAIVKAGLIKIELRDLPNLKLNNVMFVEPIPEKILCIINPQGVHKDTPPPARKGRPSPRKKGETPPARSDTYTLCSTSYSPTLTSTYDSKTDHPVDNSEQLPTVQSVTSKEEIFKKNREHIKMLLKETKVVLTANTQKEKLNGEISKKNKQSLLSKHL